jgi:uncharacterized protein
MFWPYLGLALVLIVFGYLAIGLFGAFRRVQFDAHRQAFELERFREELAVIREQRRKISDSPQTWNGFRKFVVKRKVTESEDVASFYLSPHDAKPLPEFKPGQYLTFQLPHPQKNAPLVRCYSLSDRAHPTHYRVSIKRAAAPGDIAGAPPGMGSGLFHDTIREGDILDVRAPSGHFSLELSDPEPVVLIGGGIGITPVMSMLAALVNQKSRREVWLFYGVRNRREHVFAQDLAALAREHPYLRLRVCYSQPMENDREGEDYHVKGRVSIDLLKKELPSNNYLFYYCGPGPMMEALTNDLKAWGVPEGHLHFEAFGPSSVKRVSNATTAPFAAAARCAVTFRKTGKTVPWSSGNKGSLLDLAESAGVVIASGCRAGNCGTCVVAMQSGDVTYLQPPGSPPEARTCLACIAQPKGDLVVDA